MPDDKLNQAASRPMLLTTIDNPYNPFVQWDEWNAYDVSVGHNTNSLLARVTITTEELGHIVTEEDVHLAMEQIVKENVSGVHTMVIAETLSSQ